MTHTGSLLGWDVGARQVCGVGQGQGGRVCGSFLFAQETFLMKEKQRQKPKSVQTPLQFWNLRLIGLETGRPPRVSTWLSRCDATPSQRVAAPPTCPWRGLLPPFQGCLREWPSLSQPASSAPLSAVGEGLNSAGLCEEHSQQIRYQTQLPCKSQTRSSGAPGSWLWLHLGS